MKKVILLFIFSVTAMVLFAQQYDSPQVAMNTYVSGGPPSGDCTRKALSDSLFLFEYRYYQPDISTVYALRPILVEISITVVLGTWSEDSRKHIPHFFKIMDMMKGYDNYHLVCAEHNAKGGAVSVSGLNIAKVPTFIIYRKGIEIGRIIEKPKESLEKDLLAIIVKERH